MVRFVVGLLIGALLGASVLAIAALAADTKAISLPAIDVPAVDLPRIDLPRIDLPRFDTVRVVRSTRDAIERALPPRGPRPVNVVLDRDGARLFAGPDQARLRLSSVLTSQGMTSVAVPAYRGSNARWTAVRRCLRAKFSGFAVRFLDHAPVTGDHIVVYVGGSPSMLGLEGTIRGIAPHSGRVMPNAPVFVFDRGNPPARELCQVAAHEIGHAIGLDHSRMCGDIMSYGPCKDKSFQERAAACGEYENRLCDDGSATQSSATKLESLVGRRDERVA